MSTRQDVLEFMEGAACPWNPPAQTAETKSWEERLIEMLGPRWRFQLGVIAALVILAAGIGVINSAHRDSRSGVSVSLGPVSMDAKDAYNMAKGFHNEITANIENAKAANEFYTSQREDLLNLAARMQQDLNFMGDAKTVPMANPPTTGPKVWAKDEILIALAVQQGGLTVAQRAVLDKIFDPLKASRRVELYQYIARDFCKMDILSGLSQCSITHPEQRGQVLRNIVETTITDAVAIAK